MNIKALIEKRNNLLTEMDNLLNTVSAETRAMTVEETNTYNANQAEVERLTATITAMQEAEKRAQTTNTTTGGDDGETEEQREYRAFDTFLRSGLAGELRADNNTEYADNTAIIPKTIANRIVETVKELSPIYARVTKINAKGNLVIPVWGKDGSDDITCTYATVLAKYASAYKTGVMPELKIVSSLTDVNTGASERAAVTGAVLTTLPLMGFEAKTLIDEEFPVKASGYEILEAIA